MAKHRVKQKPSVRERNPEQTRTAAKLSRKRTYSILRPKRHAFDGLFTLPPVLLHRILNLLDLDSLIDLHKSTLNGYLRGTIADFLTYNRGRYDFTAIVKLRENGVATNGMVRGKFESVRFELFNVPRQYEEPCTKNHQNSQTLVVRGYELSMRLASCSV